MRQYYFSYRDGKRYARFPILRNFYTVSLEPSSVTLCCLFVLLMFLYEALSEANLLYSVRVGADIVPLNDPQRHQAFENLEALK